MNAFTTTADASTFARIYLEITRVTVYLDMTSTMTAKLAPVRRLLVVYHQMKCAQVIGRNYFTYSLYNKTNCSVNLLTAAEWYFCE